MPKASESTLAAAAPVWCGDLSAVDQPLQGFGVEVAGGGQGGCERSGEEQERYNRIKKNFIIYACSFPDRRFPRGHGRIVVGYLVGKFLVILLLFRARASMRRSCKAFDGAAAFHGIFQGEPPFFCFRFERTDLGVFLYT